MAKDVEQAGLSTINSAELSVTDRTQPSLLSRFVHNSTFPFKEVSLSLLEIDKAGQNVTDGI